MGRGAGAGRYAAGKARSLKLAAVEVAALEAREV
jgi:hypothetical protein